MKTLLFVCDHDVSAFPGTFPRTVVTSSTFLDVRKTEVYFSGGLGKVSFGKGDGAANGTSEVDLSGTQYLGGGSAHYYASGISFLDDDGNPVGTIGGAAYNNFDALSRNNHVRYDSPSFGGVVLSGSIDNGKAVETAARYATEFGDGGKFEAAVDWLDNHDRNADINQAGDRTFSGRFKEYGGSASVLLPFGLNFTGMYKDRDSDEGGPDGESYFGGIGYIVNKHHVQLGWGRTNDLANEGSKGNSYQLAYVYKWRSDLELFASYRHLTLDNVENEGGDSVDAQDIDYLFLGTRVKFL
jgi:predicted porin